MIGYGFIKELETPFEKTVAAVTEELKKEGFGVLTSIDLKEKFKEKLNVDYNNYIILGACNPPLAYKTLQTEETIGLFLPCNVIVYEKDNKTVVGIVKPSAAMSMIDNEKLKEIAEIVEGKLKNVFDAL
ncbi:MAG: DUF302 domain-containing protein [Candidatus Latescibacteria bacterium]|nr:DUF302 domain-containing protein [Candidatus Latescibacterota bacterium]